MMDTYIYKMMDGTRVPFPSFVTKGWNFDDILFRCLSAGYACSDGTNGSSKRRRLASRCTTLAFLRMNGKWMRRILLITLFIWALSIHVYMPRR
mmetsp:Transcript_21115/g.31331  ORF Transcript_21115/g.31331 Transcript_21115/m.31331 type:complete len:94 (-) Transcript_21115:264-545(-)